MSKKGRLVLPPAALGRLAARVALPVNNSVALGQLLRAAAFGFVAGLPF